MWTQQKIQFDLDNPEMAVVVQEFLKKLLALQFFPKSMLSAGEYIYFISSVQAI